MKCFDLLFAQIRGAGLFDNVNNDSSQDSQHTVLQQGHAVIVSAFETFHGSMWLALLWPRKRRVPLVNDSLLGQAPTNSRHQNTRRGQLHQRCLKGVTLYRWS